LLLMAESRKLGNPSQISNKDSNTNNKSCLLAVDLFYVLQERRGSIHSFIPSHSDSNSTLRELNGTRVGAKYTTLH
jgi:hypothetical protein